MATKRPEPIVEDGANSLFVGTWKSAVFGMKPNGWPFQLHAALRLRFSPQLMKQNRHQGNSSQSNGQPNEVPAMDNVLIEELTLKPIGTSKELGFNPLRITIDGKSQAPVFDARDITDIKSAIRDYASQRVG